MSNTDIIKIIYEKSKGTAPVTLQFCRKVNDQIIIKEAPPAIIERLFEAGCSMGVCEDGVYVYNFK